MNAISRSWPWFSLAAALMLVACLAPNDIVAGVAALGALLSFLGACIHRLAQDVRDDPERLTPIVREIGVAGLIANELRANKRAEHSPS
jgi:hypothetical protein